MMIQHNITPGNQQYITTIRYDTIRYDTMLEMNVRSIAGSFDSMWHVSSHSVEARCELLFCPVLTSFQAVYRLF